MKTEFPKEYLAAASQFMASQDLRYYLNGVFIQVGASLQCLPTASTDDFEALE